MTALGSLCCFTIGGGYTAARLLLSKQTCVSVSQSAAIGSRCLSSFCPRRALMYVPASDARKLRKLPSLKPTADTIAIDLEDGVAVNQKDTARANLPLALSMANESNCSERIVRVNDIASGHISQDLQAVFVGGTDSEPDGLMLPKCESVEHLKQLDFLVGFYRSSFSNSPLTLNILIESPTSLLSLKSMCQYGTERLKNLMLAAFTFGSDDYLASLGEKGGQRTESAEELLYARQSFVTQVKSYGLQAIDIVSIDYKNMESLKSQCEEGARMGFTGKQIIHPGQIDVVQSAFSPSSDLIEWAEQLVTEFEKHQTSGKGAFTFRGKMIDRPLLLQAENVIKLRDALNR